MATRINFDDANRTINPMTGQAAHAVEADMFGAISITIQDQVDGIGYQNLFEQSFNALNLGYIRYPDGEMPDGFVYENTPGEWYFAHNGLNAGNNPSYFDPITKSIVNSGAQIDQAYLNALIPAFSLKYDELLHPGLASSPDRVTFSESLAFAVETGSNYALVLPEFEYLKVPYFRPTNPDGSKEAFRVEDHVYRVEIREDVTAFLNKLFLDGAYNNGVLPGDITLEIGNENYFGWNAAFFDADSTRDLDSYSAYAIAVLEAVHSFRGDHPEIRFNVGMQAHGRNYVDEIARNFADVGRSYLFGEINEIDAMHFGLDATVASAATLEDNWTITSGAQRMIDLVAAHGGDAGAVELSMSAWSANSSDVAGFGLTNHGLPAAGATLSLFSSLFELGFDSAANWGIGSWGGYGTNAVRGDGGQVEFAPYIEVYRLMAETLPGMAQLDTGMSDTGRDAEYQLYAFEDASKAVLFAAANDFAGQVTLQLDGFGGIGAVQLHRVSQSAGSDPDTVVTQEQVAVNGQQISFAFNAPYEVVRIVAAKDTASNETWNLQDINAGNRIAGNDAEDRLNGGAGSDTIFGGGGDDVVDGGADNDFLYGNAGNDLVRGGGGDDLIHGGGGTDTLSGGQGDDTFEVSVLRNQAIVTDFTSGSDTIDLSDIFDASYALRLVTPTETFWSSTGAPNSNRTGTIALQELGDDLVVTVTRSTESSADVTVLLQNISAGSFMSGISTNLDFGFVAGFASGEKFFYVVGAVANDSSDSAAANRPQGVLALDETAWSEPVLFAPPAFDPTYRDALPDPVGQGFDPLWDLM